MVVRPSSAMAEALALVAPGKPLREGLERILQAKRGALVVIGDDPKVLGICTGGFLLDAEFSPQRLAELAKMDGAIILSADAGRIARANVHLMPSPTIPTTETGTRHRTAERVARSLEVPVISVSQAMGVVTVYRGADRHALVPAGRLHERVSQALQTLERFRHRFDVAVAALSALEVEDTVTVRDVAAVLQPAELVRRIAEEIEASLLELGAEGRLFRLQLDELTEGVEEVRRLVVRDYLQEKRTEAASAAGMDGHEQVGGGRRPEGPREARRRAGRGAGQDDGRGSVGGPPGTPEASLAKLERLGLDELLDPRAVAEALGLELDHGDLDASLEPRGYRLLHRLPRFPEPIADRIVEHFAGLQRIMRASVEELEEVGGVGQARAKTVKDGLARLVEANILGRYS
uniref:DNA integrity scanning diadenylate cyclase DisA n=1 Tax=Aciditerrimonas ferrireducens TaxID=667306 RepID=UPI00406BB8CA